MSVFFEDQQLAAIFLKVSDSNSLKSELKKCKVKINIEINHFLLVQVLA